MKAALIFTCSGPILILTSHTALDDPDLASRLAAKGIYKYIANEVPFDEVRQWYGPIFDRVVTDETQDDALRILDVDSPCAVDRPAERLHLRVERQRGAVRPCAMLVNDVVIFTVQIRNDPRVTLALTLLPTVHVRRHHAAHALDLPQIVL